MNTKILTALMIIGIVSVAAGAGSFAYFSDQESSTGNTFTAGTLDLENKDGNEAWGNGVTATWTLTDMKPGTSTYGSVNLRNTGTVPGEHLEIKNSYTIADPTGPESDSQENTPPDHMAKQMKIITCKYFNDQWKINCLTGEKIDTSTNNVIATSNDWKIEDTNNNGKVTFYDFNNDQLDNLPPATSSSEEFYMGTKFDENAGNDFQGDTLNVDFTFTLNQDSSQ